MVFAILIAIFRNLSTLFLADAALLGAIGKATDAAETFDVVLAVGMALAILFTISRNSPTSFPAEASHLRAIGKATRTKKDLLAAGPLQSPTLCRPRSSCSALVSVRVDDSVWLPAHRPSMLPGASKERLPPRNLLWGLCRCHHRHPLRLQQVVAFCAPRRPRQPPTRW